MFLQRASIAPQLGPSNTLCSGSYQFEEHSSVFHHFSTQVLSFSLVTPEPGQSTCRLNLSAFSCQRAWLAQSSVCSPTPGRQWLVPNANSSDTTLPFPSARHAHFTMSALDTLAWLAGQFISLSYLKRIFYASDGFTSVQQVSLLAQHRALTVCLSRELPKSGLCSFAVNQVDVANTA